MIIAVSKSINNLAGNQLEYSMQDLATSALMLREDGLKLIKFLNYHCVEISGATLQELQANSKIIEARFSYVNLGDILIYITSDVIDWEVINILWVLRSSLNKEKGLKQILSENEDVKLSLFRYKQTLDDYQGELSRFAPFKESGYFNSLKFLSSCKALNIKAKTISDKIAMEFEDVKLGNDKEGYIYYNKIIVFLNSEGLIDGFNLIFNDFGYSSYWGLPVVMHPYLTVGYCFNQSLSFLNRNDASYAGALQDTIISYAPNSGIKTVNQILVDFQTLRHLWYGLKDNIDSKELSKVIFKELTIRTEIINESRPNTEDELKF